MILRYYFVDFANFLTIAELQFWVFAVQSGDRSTFRKTQKPKAVLLPQSTSLEPEAKLQQLVVSECLLNLLEDFLPAFEIVCNQND
jgi:hypothetical protein